ncbi:MAG: radical SAM family heme chaperone HemW [Coprococcus sp.]
MKELSIYIHIPFCIKKCNYCDFLSFEAGESFLCGMGIHRKAYIDVLCAEIKSYSPAAKEYIISTVFIGGGTPSILMPGDITRIMVTLRNTFDFVENPEISIEVNPGTLTPAKAKEYIECGINRMSIGLQSANDDELAMLGRIHNYDQFLAAFNAAREAGFRNINVDVMAALPCQTVHSYLDTLEKVLKCCPEHISSYSLIVEENTPISQNAELLALLPDEELERQMYEATERVLSLVGYERYEISNYAKSGFECRHNIVYWTLGEYIGIGIGASSFWKNRRFSNTQNMEKYIEAFSNYTASSDIMKVRTIDETLNVDRLMEEYMFLGLRMMKGISVAEFNDYFGHSVYNIYGTVIDKYIKSGHLINDGGIIKLTKKGIDVSNVILADFLLD